MQSQTINISLPTLLVRQVDEMALEDYASRSDFIRQALLEKIRQRQEWQQIFIAGRKAAKRLGIKSEDEVNKIVYEFRHGKKSN